MKPSGLSGIKTNINRGNQMLEDRLKWNRRYHRETGPQEPSEIVRKYAPLAHGKRALDIAAGNGRNTLLLADQGFVVDAIDIADAGLALFSGKHPDVNPIWADFDQFDISANCYDLIVNIKFLNRRLFPYITGGLAPGGVLIFQTFLRWPHVDQNSDDHTDYYLRPNELLNAFLTLNILLYRETSDKTDDDSAWLASLVARKAGCAMDPV
jgi:SAM-dependent methyltransferase